MMELPKIVLSSSKCRGNFSDTPVVTRNESRNQIIT